MMLVSMNHKELYKERIDYIKHLATDVWIYVFHSPMSKIITGHTNQYHLKINDFEWISVLSDDKINDANYDEKIKLYLSFVCGILRGELMVMGFESKIEAKKESDGYSFSVTITKS